MRNIQDVGTEILQNTPKKFYIFVGEEYGIKMKYIEILSKHFGCRILTASGRSGDDNITHRYRR